MGGRLTGVMLACCDLGASAGKAYVIPRYSTSPKVLRSKDSTRTRKGLADIIYSCLDLSHLRSRMREVSLDSLVDCLDSAYPTDKSSLIITYLLAQITIESSVLRKTLGELLRPMTV